MKSISELNPRNYPTNNSIESNLKILYQRLQELQGAFGADFVITSGLRSDEKQSQLIQLGKSQAFHSKHLAGAAADILDKDGNLAEYCLANEEVLARIGLWIEDPHFTKGWLHAQMMPPKSGKRVFIP